MYYVEYGENNGDRIELSRSEVFTTDRHLAHAREYYENQELNNVKAKILISNKKVYEQFGQEALVEHCKTKAYEENFLQLDDDEDVSADASDNLKLTFFFVGNIG